MSEPRWALVTGASRGIGRAVAERLLAHGRNVLVSARDAAALHALEQAHPGRVIALPCDLAQPGAASSLIDQAVQRAGSLRELVLAAGIVHYASFDSVTELSLRAQLELNFVAPFLLMQRALEPLRKAGGAMVVIASTLATHPAPATSAYAASKAALISTARSCALEQAPHVRVNVIAPGVIDTDMIRAPRSPLEQGEDPAQRLASQLAALRSLHPLARLGSVDDVAQAALYLLDAPWLTGTVLTVDGGLTLG